MFAVVATLFLAEAFVQHKHNTLAAPKKVCKNATKVSLLRKARLDPHCSEGIMNAAMTACCQADCGECHDESDICNGKATNGRGTTCCPVDMLAGNLPSCENSKAPCAIPDYVRATPDIS